MKPTAGLTDAEAFLGYRTQGLLIGNDFLMARIGTTIPFGKTEEDPVETRRQRI